MGGIEGGVGTGQRKSAGCGGEGRGSHRAKQGGPKQTVLFVEGVPGGEQTVDLWVRKIHFPLIRDSAQTSFTDSLLTSH